LADVIEFVASQVSTAISADAFVINAITRGLSASPRENLTIWEWRRPFGCAHDCQRCRDTAN
jgi:hypothetical protein